MARERAVVMEGRDIGTVVLPAARWKYFLTATAEERAKRRMKDFEAANHKAEFDRLLADIVARDDADNAVGPIKVAQENAARAQDGIVHLDTTELTLDEVVEQIVKNVRRA
jgi:cytidylate kinase